MRCPTCVGASVGVYVLSLRSRCYALAARTAEARRDLERALGFAQEKGDLQAQSNAEVVLVDLAVLLGDVPLARAHAQRLLELGDRGGSTVVQLFGHRAHGSAALLAGEPREAAQALEEALGIMRGAHTPLNMEGVVLSTLAVAYALLRDMRARACSDEAVSVLDRRADLSPETIHMNRARVLRLLDGAGARTEIAAALAEAERLAEARGAASMRPFIGVERAELARLVGDDVTCQRELREAHRLFTEMGATARTAEVEKELTGGRRSAPQARGP